MILRFLEIIFSDNIKSNSVKTLDNGSNRENIRKICVELKIYKIKRENRKWKTRGSQKLDKNLYNRKLAHSIKT